MAAIGEKIGKDIIEAMKAKEPLRLETLRMAKSAMKNKEIDKREPLTDAEETAVLNTMVKQRKDAAEQFAKGNRPELASKEQDEIHSVISGAIAHLAADGSKPGPKDIGPAMRVVQARIMSNGLHADMKRVSELLKEELAK